MGDQAWSLAATVGPGGWDDMLHRRGTAGRGLHLLDGAGRAGDPRCLAGWRNVEVRVTDGERGAAS